MLEKSTCLGCATEFTWESSKSALPRKFCGRECSYKNRTLNKYLKDTNGKHKEIVPPHYALFVKETVATTRPCEACGKEMKIRGMTEIGKRFCTPACYRSRYPSVATYIR